VANVVAFSDDVGSISLKDCLRPYAAAPRVIQPSGSIVGTTRTAYLVLDGFCGQSIDTDKRRHIVGLGVRGDFINLNALVGRTRDHQTFALGPVTVAPIIIPNLTTFLNERPEVGNLMLAESLRAEAISRCWTMRLAMSDAPHKIAHLIAELQHRLHPDDSSIKVLRTPFTQSDIGDMCGISSIHANRALGALREMDIGEMRRGDFYVRDWLTLKNFASFDPGYLRA